MSASSAAAPKRVLSLFVASLLTTGAVALALPGTAQADSQPLAGTVSTVTADALPTVQINGVAWAQVVVGNTVYVGGDVHHGPPRGRGRRHPGDGPHQPARLRHPHRCADQLVRARPQRPGAGRHRLPGRVAPVRRRRLHPGRRCGPQPGRRLRHRHRHARDRLAPERQQPGARARRDRATPSTWAAASPPSAGSAAPAWPPSPPPTASCCPGRPSPTPPPPATGTTR